MLLLLTGCSSRNLYDSSIPVFVEYRMSNSLMRSNMVIEIKNDELKVSFKSLQKNYDRSFKIVSADIDTLVGLLRSVNFASIQPLKGDKLLDAPAQLISASYDNKTNAVNFGFVKNPPVEITNLKSLIFNIFTKYDSNWKSKIGPF